jgi:hypothetical protein
VCPSCWAAAAPVSDNSNSLHSHHSTPDSKQLSPVELNSAQDQTPEPNGKVNAVQRPVTVILNPELSEELKSELETVQNSQQLEKHSSVSMTKQNTEVNSLRSPGAKEARGTGLTMGQSLELEIRQSPEIKMGHSPELKIGQSPELKIGQSPELKIGQDPELNIKQSPKLKTEQSPELKTKQSPEMEAMWRAAARHQMMEGAKEEEQGNLVIDEFILPDKVYYIPDYYSAVGYGYCLVLIRYLYYEYCTLRLLCCPRLS